jgi:repressor of nif and glnA expression
MIILAVAEKPTGASTKEIALYIKENGEEDKMIERLKSSIRYHIQELKDMGVIREEKIRIYTKYSLESGVEILDGKMVSTGEDGKQHADDVGRIMRLTDKDGFTVIRLLDMM